MEELQRVNLGEPLSVLALPGTPTSSSPVPCKHGTETVRIMSLKGADRPAFPQVPGEGGEQLRHSSCVCFFFIYIFFSPSKVPGVNSS